MHIRRSRTSVCSAAYHEDLQAAAGSNGNPSDDIEEVSRFHGDFFGDYMDSDLPWPAEAELDKGAEDDDVNNDNGIVTDDDNNDNNDIINDDDYMDIDRDGHQGGPLNQETTPVDCQGADGTFVEHFPSGNAGAAISVDPGCIETDYGHYQKQFGYANEYAPFASRTEWDIARWAKLHRISSTAVTELLGFKGVGFYVTRYV